MYYFNKLSIYLTQCHDTITRMLLGYDQLGSVVRNWVKFNLGLGETLNLFLILETRTVFFKVVLKYTPIKPNYVHPN